MITNPQRSIDLLTKISTHLRSGNLAHHVFDFSVISDIRHENLVPKVPHCGTAGCAIGEFPVIFPGEFFYSREKVRGAVGISKTGDNPIDCYNGMSIIGYIADFLGIERSQVNHFFAPGRQITSKYGGHRLHYDASAYDVADNIDEFIEVVLKPLVKDIND